MPKNWKFEIFRFGKISPFGRNDEFTLYPFPELLTQQFPPMKQILSLLAVLTFSVTAISAETDSQRIAAQIAPLLNDSVAIVVHLDCTKVDPEKLDADIRPILAKYGLPTEPLDSVTKTIQPAFESLTALKIRNVYFLTHLPLLPEYPGVLVVPLEKESDAEAVDQVLRTIPPNKDSRMFVTKTNGRFLFLLPHRQYGQTSVDDFVWKTIEAPPTERPELLAALESVEGTGVQFALIPPSYAKRVLEESGFDTLPPPLDKTPISVVTNGVKWAVLAADTEALQLRLVVRSEHEQAALDLRNLLEQAVDAYLDNDTSADFRIFEQKLKAAGTDARSYLKLFLPVPRENRLELTIDETFVNERTKIVTDLPALMLDSVLANAHQAECRRNLQTIVLALHNHHDTYLKFPPLHTVDKDGKPLHSWRVAILPYLEQNDLYKKIRLDEPWDSEYNKQFHSLCPAVFQCPQAAFKNPAIKRDGLTTYSVIVGKNAWPEGAKPFEFSMITDGTSNTLAVVERQTPVCWMDPTQEITQEDAMLGIGKSEKGIGAVHPTGSRQSTLTAFFDGSVHVLAENLSLESLKGLVTRNGGESFSLKYDD